MPRKISALSVWVFLAAVLTVHGQYWVEDRSSIPALESSAGYASEFPFLVSPGGKVLVSPSYSFVNSHPLDVPVRLNRDGSVDSSFNAPAEGLLFPLAVYPDGRVLARRVVYRLPDTLTDSDAIYDLVRLRPDGSLDPSFAPFGLVNSVTVRASILSDGNVLLVGPFRRTGTLDFRCIAVLGPDGTASTSFRSPFPLPVQYETPPEIYSAFAAPGGRFVVTGSFRNLGSGKFNYLARLNPDGSVDPTFNASALNLTRDPVILAVNPDGSMLISTGSTSPSLIRILPTGARDLGYQPPLVTALQAFGARQSDGKIYYLARPFESELRRLNFDGSPDAAFLVKTSLLPTVADDGTLFIAGPLTKERGAQGNHLSHLTAGGVLDPDFSPRFGTRGSVSGFLRLPDARAVVAGSFERINGVAAITRRSIVRLNADGSFDPTFVATWPDDENLDFTRFWHQPTGKVLVRKIPPFTGAPSQPAPFLIRFNPDGSRDSAFAAFPVKPNSPLEIDRAGFIYTTTDEATPRFVRYTPDGELDSSFQSPLTPRAWRCFPLDDGTLVALLLDRDDNRILLRLRHDGSIDANFDLSKGLEVFVRRDFSGVGSLPDGRIVWCFADERTYGSTMTILRTTPGGGIDYRFTTRGNGQDSFTDYLTVGGIYFDLLKESGAAAGTLYPLRVGTRVLSVDPVGKLLDPAFSPAVYRRTALPGPSYAAAPYIDPIRAPAAWSNPAGSELVFGATVSGLEPLSYQWKKNGIAIPGATGVGYTIDSSTPSDTGEYTLTATNAYGSQTTSPSYISIDASTFAGTYTGTIAGGATGRFSLLLRPDATGILLLYLTTSETGLLFEDIRIAADGTITGSGGRLLGDSRGLPAAPYNIAAKITGTTTVSGTIGGANLTFTGAKAPASYFGDSHGYFFAPATGNRSAALYAIAGWGSVLVVLADSSFAQGTTGSTFNDRLVLAAISPFALTGTFNLVTGQVALTATSNTFAGTAFTGARRSLPPSDRLANMSTRGRAGSGSDMMIAGFVLTGSASRTLLIRAIGPALGSFGVSGALADPRLELFRGATKIAENNDWSAAADIVAATARVGGFPLASGSADSALLVTLEPGSYTAQVSAAPGIAAGAALVEIYDAGSTGVPATAEPRLANLATRGRIAAPGDSVVAGIVITGTTPKQILIRAIGPGLASFGVAGALADPTLTVTGTSSSGADFFATNDDWDTTRRPISAGNIADAALSVGAFSLPYLSKDACLLLTLAPGNYTAQVTGKNSATGIALVEVYEVNN
jgi:uncharacterized delta-60 repeat protein